MERLGFRVTHLYGLTECYGPATLCAWQEEWAGLPLEERAAKMARQGVNHTTLEAVRVADPATGLDVPRDGATVGELLDMQEAGRGRAAAGPESPRPGRPGRP